MNNNTNTTNHIPTAPYRQFNINDFIGTFKYDWRERALDVANAARKAGFSVSRIRGNRDEGFVITISERKPETTRARKTGTLVTLCKGDDLPWMLICEEHSGCCEFETKREALWHRADPESFCEWCNDIRRGTDYAGPVPGN